MSKHLRRNKLLSNNLYHEILRNNSENNINLYFKEGVIPINKFLFHIISEYKLDERTDAILIPDISYDKTKDLIENILNMSSNKINSIEEHEFWLDKDIYKSIKTVESNLNKSQNKRKISSNDIESIQGNKKARKLFEIKETSRDETSNKEAKNSDSLENSYIAARYML